MKPNEKIVVLGADHNGIALKEEVKKMLQGLGYSCIDIGPFAETGKVDYVDYARTVSAIVDKEDARWGVLMCGTGVGMSMVANRFNGVRASLVHSLDVARKTREHNDANVLCLGAWVNSTDVNLAITRAWFGEPFGEHRHVKRVEKTKVHPQNKVVFTNGIFDILHPGHLETLKFAKSLGGRLVVGINSDRATKVLKGPDRPINNEHVRKTTLESLSFVDEVVIFDDTKTFDIINHLKPDVVVKGGEWTAAEVRKRDKIPDDIEVRVCPLLADKSGIKLSTTRLIEQIQHDEPAPPALPAAPGKSIAFPSLTRGKLLVIGDLIIDIYQAGTPLGLSVETPTIVMKHESTNVTLGGAGFLVRNMLALGGSVLFATLVGNDAYAAHEKNFSHKKLTKHILCDPKRMTTVKERFWADNHKLLAWDRVSNTPLSKSLERELLSFVRANIKSCDKVIISDYRHGLLSEHVAHELIRIAHAAKKVVYVDSQVSKQVANHHWYRGADLFCINIKEAKSIDPSFEEKELRPSLLKLRKVLGTPSIILKLGAQGSLARIGEEWIETPGVPVAARDTTGAGDAFFAVVALSSHLGVDELRAANAWAALKTTRLGTETPARAELETFLKHA